VAQRSEAEAGTTLTDLHGGGHAARADRAAARARWARAQRAFDAAKAEVGPPLGNRSHLLLGPLSRQAEHARSGGDPSVYDEQVAEGRTMLTSALVSRGDNSDQAAAKADALAAAYATWAATPEA
jgi:hypothetical protein